MALTPTPERLLTGMVDGAIRLWDIPTSNQVPGFSKLNAAVTAVAFSHDGTRLAAGDASGDLFVFDADTESEVFGPTGLNVIDRSIDCGSVQTIRDCW